MRSGTHPSSGRPTVGRSPSELVAIGQAIRELLRGNTDDARADAEIRDLGVRISCAAMTMVGSRRAPAPARAPGHLESAIAAAAAAAVEDAEYFEPATDDDEIARTMGSAVATWVRDEIDLDAILAVLGSAFDLVSRALAETEPPTSASGRAETVRALSLLIDIRGRVIGTVSGAFVREADHDHAPPQHSPRESFTTSVLAGRMDIRQAIDFGIPAADRYQVLAMVLADGARGGRQLRTAVPEIFGEHALWLLGAAGGTVVLPIRTPADVVDAEKVSEMAATIGTAVTCTSVVGGAEEVHRLAAAADELLELTQAIGKPAGLYSLADLVVEYQVTRPGPARDRLAAIIRPLESNAPLLETLRTHLSCGLNRRETARRLSIHPNTVDNRMTKVAETIGLDLSRPRSIAQTQSAILAFDAAGAVAAR